MRFVVPRRLCRTRCPTCGGSLWALVSLMTAYIAVLLVYLVIHGDLVYVPLFGFVVGWLPISARP